MSTSQEITTRPSTNAALMGIIAKVARQYDMDEDKYARVMIATIFPKGRNAPEPTLAHVAALCVVADRYGLDPMVKQVYAFPDKQGGIVPIISIDGWLFLANRHKEFDGIEFDFIDDDDGNVIACTCTVYRKDRSHPTRVTEYVNECKRNTDPWNNQPRRMIRHRATIQCIRVAFNIAASDPEDAERIPEYEFYPQSAGTDDPVAKINAEIGAEESVDRTTGEVTNSDSEPEPEPEPETGNDYEPTTAPSAVGHTPTDVKPEPEAKTEPKAEPKTEPKASRKRNRTPRGFALKIQRDEFAGLLDDKTIDEAYVSVALPEEPEALEDAFASMSKQDAEALLVRARSGEFRGPVKEAAPSPDTGPQAPETGGGPEMAPPDEPGVFDL